MASNDVTPISDMYAPMGLIRNPDGSITRIPEFFPTTPASSDPSNPVLTKDIPINQQNKTWARLYLPRSISGGSAGTPTTKLPVIFYYHGSAFIVCSAASTMFQKFCCDIVQQIPALMVSLEYRLAPEHRLPAAYDDCLEALHWVTATGEEWLTKYADFSRCFLLGSSAGGNIAYHVGSRAVASVDQLLPLKIQGLILHHSYFGGVERTPSEIRLANDRAYPLAMNDLALALALPIGVDRDHEYSNPMKAPNVGLLDKMKNQRWRFLVIGYRGDPLVDRQIGLAKMLRENGLDVEEKFYDGGSHGVDIRGLGEPEADIFYAILKTLFFKKAH